MVLAAWFAMIGWAQSAEPFRARRVDCTVFQSVRGKWERLTPSQARALLGGRGEFQGVSAQEGRSVVFEVAGRRFVTSAACLVQVQPVRSEAPLVATVAPQGRRTWEAALELYSWQEPLTLESSAGNFALNLSHLGPMPSVVWNIRSTPTFLLGLKVAGFFGQSEVAEATGATVSAVQYRVTGSYVFGGLVGPRLALRLPEDRGEVALWIPVALRIGNWASVDDSGVTYTPTPRTALFVSGFLETRLSLSRRLGLSFGAGFVRSWTALAWTAGVQFKGN